MYHTVIKYLSLSHKFIIFYIIWIIVGQIVLFYMVSKFFKKKKFTSIKLVKYRKTDQKVIIFYYIQPRLFPTHTLILVSGQWSPKKHLWLNRVCFILAFYKETISTVQSFSRYVIETLGNRYIKPTLSLFFISQTQTLKLSLFQFQSLKLSLSLSLSIFSTMARFSFVALVLMAVLVGSALAQSPSQSPSKSPTQAPAPKASAPSPTVRKTPVPAPSPAVVNSPPSPPPASSEAPVSPPSSISTPPAEAPGPAQSGAVLNRVGFAAGSVAVAVFSAVLVF